MITGSFEATGISSMNIVNFLEKVEGTWFSQRSTHFSQGQPSQTGQALLKMLQVEPSDPHVVRFCEQCSIEPKQIAFALHVQQEEQASTYGEQAPNPQKVTVVVGLKGEADTGDFYSQTEQESVVDGQYRLENDVLTLSIQEGSTASEERIWFMNPNLRMRTCLLKRQDGFQMASFCSEIRRLS
jgi:hypothetical protein